MPADHSCSRRFALVLLALGPPASAQSLFWDANGTAPGAGSAPVGTWGVDAFWNSDATGGAGGTFFSADSALDHLVFVAGPAADSGSAAYAVTLDGARAANSLTFQASGAATLSGGTSLSLGAGGLQIPSFAFGSTANGAVSIATPVVLTADQTWTHAGANALTLTGGLSGAFDLTKAGGGALNVTQATSPDHADTRVEGGRVNFNIGVSAGSFQFGSGVVTVDNGGRFHFNASAGSLTLLNNLAVGPGGGTFSTPSSTGRTYTYSGSIWLGGPVTLGLVDGGGGGAPGAVFTGPVTIDQATPGARRITLSSGGNHGPTLSGNIADGAGGAGNPLWLRVVDSNNGRDVTLTGVNAYAGDTVVQGAANGAAAGRAILAAPGTPDSFALGQGNITVESGAMLRLGANAVLAPGRSITVTQAGNQPTLLALARNVDPAALVNPASSGSFVLGIDGNNTTPTLNLATLSADGSAILGSFNGVNGTFAGAILPGLDGMYRFGAGGSAQGTGGSLLLSAVNALSGTASVQVGGWYGNTGREGHGTLVLGAVNSLAGDFTVAAGNSQAGSVLAARATGAFGSSTNQVRLVTSTANGPTLRFETASQVVTNPVVLQGTGTGNLVVNAFTSLQAGITQEDASSFAISGSAGVELTTAASAATGKTALNGGVLSLSAADQIGDGNLNLNGGVLLFNGLSWNAFTADRAAGLGSGVDQWQFNGGGFAARGAAVTIDAASTTETTFDRSFTLGSALTGPDALLYANAPVILDRGAGLNTIALSAASNRQLTLAGGASFPSSVWNLAGPVNGIAGKVTGGASGRLWYFSGAGPAGGQGLLRLSNPGNDFTANLVLAGNTATPPDAGSGVLVVSDDAALGNPANTLTVVSSSPSGSGSGWMIMLEDAAEAGNVFNRVIVNESRGSPVAPPVGLGAFSGRPVFTGSITVVNQSGANGTGLTQAFNFQTQSGATLTLGTAGDAADLAGNRLGSATQVWRKTGPGTLVLGNVNVTNATGGHHYQIYEGSLREAGADPQNSLNQARLVFTHLGVLETSGTFSRPLGSTTTGQVSWSNGAGAGGLGGGGFAAFGGPLTVDLNATDGNLEWNDANFVRDNAPLVFGSQTANDRVTLVDNLGLDDADNATVTREIRVIDNPASPADVAEISGIIRSRGTGGSGGTGTKSLTKTGTGTLVLSGANTYNGTTTVAEGTLEYQGSLTPASSPVIVSVGATLAGTGNVARPAQISGTLSPAGDALGRLSIAQLDIAAGGILRADIGGVPGADGVDVSGSVTLAAGAEILALPSGNPATNSVHTVVNNLGPNPVNGTFSRLGLALTEGTSFASGSLTLRISYMGGDGNDVTLTVLSSSPSGYTVWIGGFGLAPGDRDETDDPDGDGMNNLLEYFAALDPSQPSAPMSTALDATATTLRFTFRRANTIPDLGYTFEWSPDLTSWFPANGTHVFTESIIGGDLQHDLMRATLTYPLSAQRLYARVRITRSL